jgi:hypothetical protein
MRLEQLLNGLRPNSQIGAAMLAELVGWHEKLVTRSVANRDWTEQTQGQFELVHAILRHNDIFV